MLASKNSSNKPCALHSETTRIFMCEDGLCNFVVGAQCQSFVLELMFNKAKSVKRHQQRSPGTMLDNTTNRIF